MTKKLKLIAVTLSVVVALLAIAATTYITQLNLVMDFTRGDNSESAGIRLIDSLTGLVRGEVLVGRWATGDNVTITRPWVDGSDPLIPTTKPYMLGIRSDLAAGVHAIAIQPSADDGPLITGYRRTSYANDMVNSEYRNTSVRIGGLNGSFGGIQQFDSRVHASTAQRVVLMSGLVNNVTVIDAIVGVRRHPTGDVTMFKIEGLVSSQGIVAMEATKGLLIGCDCVLLASDFDLLVNGDNEIELVITNNSKSDVWVTAFITFSAS
ncbi:MAG: hypothetical protein O2821_06270 [Chloroflexi bacterium]|nr:hypothetical protein [Chloroflexota bacterium]MDA1226349.1 hypothetical protein [Chloroflexota bacterium]